MRISLTPAQQRLAKPVIAEGVRFGDCCLFAGELSFDDGEGLVMFSSGLRSIETRTRREAVVLNALRRKVTRAFGRAA
jgi:hypothetical protein